MVAGLHKKSWDYARKVRTSFTNNPNDIRKGGVSPELAGYSMSHE
jgi:hypothetical protein